MHTISRSIESSLRASYIWLILLSLVVLNVPSGWSVDLIPVGSLRQDQSQGNVLKSSLGGGDSDSQRINLRLEQRRASEDEQAKTLGDVGGSKDAGELT